MTGGKSQQWRTDAATFRELPPIAPPVDVTNAEAFPEIARAAASFAAKSPEERARLERDWL